jgi:preprotein translocase subunit SecE
MKNNFLIRYFIESWQELKKVTWPTRKEIINHTMIVIVSVVVATSLTAAVDYGLSSLVQYVVERGN